MALKHLTTLIAAAALSLATVAATPVHAGSGKDLFKLAVGIGALAIIADQAKHANRNPVITTHDRSWRDDRGWHDERRWNDGRSWHNGRDLNYYHDPRYLKFRHAQQFDIPRTCLYRHWTRHGWETVASRSCVKRYAKKRHIHRQDILPRYRDRYGRIVWLTDKRDWIQ